MEGGRLSVVRVPVRIVWAGEMPLLALGRIDPRRLTGPFWYADVGRHATVDALVPLDSVEADTGRLGLIGGLHHMTRCGSTLVMRQISSIPGLFGISEPMVFQHLLDGPAAAPELTRQRIRTLVALHRDALSGRADRFAIKWPASMAHHAALLRDALPEVPMLFLHRDPVAVMHSIARDPLGEPVRGGQSRMAPSLRLHGIADDAAIADPLERLAHLVAGCCIAAARAGGMARLDYSTLPAATTAAILPYFGVAPTPADAQRAANVARHHSKQPGSRAPFVEEEPAGNAPAAGLAERILAPALDMLTGRLEPLANWPVRR